MCKLIAGSKLRIEHLQARLSPKQEVAAFIALLHQNLMNDSPGCRLKLEGKLDWVIDHPDYKPIVLIIILS